MRYQQLITELQVVSFNDDDEYEGKDVLFNTIDGKVFIYTYDDRDALIERLQELYDLEEDEAEVALNSEHPKFVVGGIIDNNLVLPTIEETSPNSTLNKQVQKIIKQLDLSGVTYTSSIFDDEGEETELEDYYPREEVINANVSTAKFYHGTSTKFLKSIMSKGLMGNSVTNFAKIDHDDKVFIATKLNKAAFHAITACEKHGGIPVILVIRITDTNKLILDYDIAVDHYGIDHPLVVKLGYDQIFHASGSMYANYDGSDKEEWEKLADKSSINTKTGIFGYQGRIPAGDIKGFYVDEESVAYEEVFGDVMKSLPEMVKDSLGEAYKSYSDFVYDVNNLVDEYSEELDDDEDY